MIIERDVLITVDVRVCHRLQGPRYTSTCPGHGAAFAPVRLRKLHSDLTAERRPKGADGVV